MLFMSSADFFFKIIFLPKISFRDTIRVTNIMPYSLHAGLFFKLLLSPADFFLNLIFQIILSGTLSNVTQF